MPTTRPGRGKPFPAGTYTSGQYNLTLSADGSIRVKPGDTVSGYSGCLYKDVLMGWEEFGRPEGGVVKPLKDPGQIKAGETLYHIPTRDAGQDKAPVAPGKPTGRPYLLFDGKHLHWKTENGTSAFSMPAVSGLMPNNPQIDRLIKAGRKDVQKGVDYTDPKYQDIPGAGPIPEGSFALPLRPGMPFDKTEEDGAGWGVGAWRLESTTRTDTVLRWIDARVIDLPGVRSGFFLHEDGGDNGTAGCIGLSERSDVLKLRQKLVEYHAQGRDRIIITVDY